MAKPESGGPFSADGQAALATGEPIEQVKATNHVEAIVTELLAKNIVVLVLIAKAKFGAASIGRCRRLKLSARPTRGRAGKS